MVGDFPLAESIVGTVRANPRVSWSLAKTAEGVRVRVEAHVLDPERRRYALELVYRVRAAIVAASRAARVTVGQTTDQVSLTAEVDSYELAALPGGSMHRGAIARVQVAASRVMGDER